MVDRLLFQYISKSKGFSLGSIAKALDLSRSQLSRRLAGLIEFRRDEMQKWCELVGSPESLVPVFFPDLARQAGPIDAA